MKFVNKKIVILSILFVSLLLLAFFIVKSNQLGKFFIRPNNNFDELSIPVEQKGISPSPFSNHISKSDNVFGYPPKVQENFETSAVFQANLSKYGYGNWENILSDKQVAVEVLGGVGKDKQYRLLFSKDASLNHKTGDIIDINFILFEPEALTMVQGVSLKFGFSEEEIGSFEEDILEIGDTLAFSCYYDNCADGLLSWALVLKK